MSSSDFDLAKIDKNPLGFISDTDDCFRCDDQSKLYAKLKISAIFLLTKVL